MKKLVALLVLIVLSTSTSCLKKQNLEEENLGPAITPESLSKAMLEGFGPLDYGAIAPNEFSSYVLSQTIQDSAHSAIEQQDMTIESVTDSPEKLSMGLILTKIKYSGGQSSQSTRKWDQEFTKAAGKATNQSLKNLADNDPPTFLFIYFQSLAFGACFDEGDFPETCHNLSVSDFKFPVPQTAISQHNCTEGSECSVNARKIEFDAIQKAVIDKDGKPRRIHYTFIISSEVPYLSRVLKFCSRTLYEISDANQKILADICYDVNNYAFGGTQK